MMPTSIYWFRNDLRLADNPALTAAGAVSDNLPLLHVKSPDESLANRWGFARSGEQRRAFRDQALRGLADEVARRGSELWMLQGQPEQVIPLVAERTGATRVFCERIAAPEEIAAVGALRAAGLEVCEQWQSSLLEPADLPFPLDQLPEVFTRFRQAVESAGISPPAPIDAPRELPPTLPRPALPLEFAQSPAIADPAWQAFSDPAFDGAERSALAHVARYFGSAKPQTYKATRNGLTGIDYSTKFSPWLAVGALSPRTVFHALRAHEARCGANDSTYWIGFELLWRDFFRFWSMKHGARLFKARGLAPHRPLECDPAGFARWRAADTGHAFVDAGMRELAATGYLSNRMRQVVASYLVHDLRGDWRAGAAWFEACLIDYDVYSNQGNWLYIAGRGADPRHGRRFNPDRQAAQYDPRGDYRARWAGRSAT